MNNNGRNSIKVISYTEKAKQIIEWLSNNNYVLQSLESELKTMSEGESYGTKAKIKELRSKIAEKEEKLSAIMEKLGPDKAEKLRNEVLETRSNNIEKAEAIMDWLSRRNDKIRSLVSQLEKTPEGEIRYNLRKEIDALRSEITKKEAELRVIMSQLGPIEAEKVRNMVLETRTNRASNSGSKDKEEKNSIKELIAQKEEELKKIQAELIKAINDNDIKKFEELEVKFKAINKELAELKQKSGENNATNEFVEKATKQVELAEKNKTRASIKAAYEAVESLEDSKEKDELLARLDKLVIEITLSFKETIDNYEEIIEKKPISINTHDVVDEKYLKPLTYIFNELYRNEVPEINFSKAEYGKKLNKIIAYYNMQEQNNYKVNKVAEKPNWFKTLLKSMKETKPLLIANKKLNLKHYKKQLAKNKIKEEEKTEALNEINQKLGEAKNNPENGNADKKNKKGKKNKPESKLEKQKNKLESQIQKAVSKQENAEQALQEIDIVNSAKLFRARYKLDKLKETLYKTGFAGLSDKDRKKYEKAVTTISNELWYELDKITSAEKENALEDKYRAKTVIAQYLELLSRCREYSAFLKGLKKVEYDNEHVRKATLAAIDYAKTAKAISEESAKAYVDEADNIPRYRKAVDDYYEIVNESLGENMSSHYVELDEAAKYYANPIKFVVGKDEKGKDITEDISYIKKSRK